MAKQVRQDEIEKWEEIDPTMMSDEVNDCLSLLYKNYTDVPYYT